MVLLKCFQIQVKMEKWKHSLPSRNSQIRETERISIVCKTCLIWLAVRLFCSLQTLLAKSGPSQSSPQMLATHHSFFCSGSWEQHKILPMSWKAMKFKINKKFYSLIKINQLEQKSKDSKPYAKFSNK